MPPVAAALLPHPPLLVRELAGGAAAELDPLRAACRQALDAVLRAAHLTILVGDGPVWGVPQPAAHGSFRPYGADVEVALPSLTDLDLAGLPEPHRLTNLPLSLAMAAYLLADLGPAPPHLFAATVPASLGPGAAASVGHALTVAAEGPDDPDLPASGTGPVGLVAMGDLSACRTPDAPGAFRPEAAGFDASVAEAFRTGEPARLLDLDPEQALELLVAGRVPLQVLAGAFGQGTSARGPGGAGPPGWAPAVRGVGGAEAPGWAPAVRGRVLYEDAPYGVGYLVALLSGP